LIVSARGSSGNLVFEAVNPGKRMLQNAQGGTCLVPPCFVLRRKTMLHGTTNFIVSKISKKKFPNTAMESAKRPLSRIFVAYANLKSWVYAEDVMLSRHFQKCAVENPTFQ
jgi:hypothetical protein